MGSAAHSRFNASLNSIAGNSASSFSEGFFVDEELMPQPLTEPYTLMSKPKLVLDYPEHAIGIALVASEWAALESHLISSFSFCLFALHADGVPSQKIAATAWHNLDSLKARLDLLKAIAADRIPRSLLADFVSVVEPEIRKRAGERNKIVHGHWHSSNKYPADLILGNPDPTQLKRYSVKDFHNVADRIIATANVVGSFWIAVEGLTRPQYSLN